MGLVQKKKNNIIPVRLLGIVHDTEKLQLYNGHLRSGGRKKIVTDKVY